MFGARQNMSAAAHRALGPDKPVQALGLRQQEMCKPTRSEQLPKTSAAEQMEPVQLLPAKGGCGAARTWRCGVSSTSLTMPDVNVKLNPYETSSVLSGEQRTVGSMNMRNYTDKL